MKGKGGDSPTLTMGVVIRLYLSLGHQTYAPRSAAKVCVV